MAKIREDLVGVVSVGGLNLSAGETVPDGVTVGDHVLEKLNAETVEKPAVDGFKTGGVLKEPAQDEKPATRRRSTRKTEGE